MDYMKTFASYIFLRKQIPLMIGLSLIPSLGYIFLAWMHDIAMPAIIWYVLNIFASIWGYDLYKNYHPSKMSTAQTKKWFNQLTLFFLLIFSLWTLIFVLYVPHEEGHLNYIAIFTQIGSAVVASTLLASNRRLFVLTQLFLLIPLAIYFFMIGALYGYILAIFSLVLMGVLLYASFSSYKLIEKSYYQASHDHLTSLKNRRFFIGSLERTVSNLQESQKYAFLLLIDLDHFKSINDSLGHDIGDKLLQVVSIRLQKHVNEEQLLARLGGDEFVIVSQEFETKAMAQEYAVTLAKTLLSVLKKTFIIDIHHLYISASIGVEIIDKEVSSANRIIKEADIAMYEVKAQGRDGVVLFNDALAERIEHHLQIERQLHIALVNKEIKLVYQPQLDQDKKIIGCEVLARWHNRRLGDVPPDDFIPVAEHTGLIVELGNYILDHAFYNLAQWHKKGIILEQYSINISVRQLFHNSFLKEVERILNKHHILDLPVQIIFEITETVLVEDLNKVVEIMATLAKMKVAFSMDDFGTGYSSLSYLKAMPVAELKIDKSFIFNLGDDSSDQAMVVTILNMAKIFNLKVVAEGVETKAQRDFLKANDCDIFQGYYYSKPLKGDDFEHFYQTHGSEEERSLATELS